MNTSELPKSLDIVPAQQRRATQARVLQSLSGITQIGLMIALFVMWKQFNVPFKIAFERCFVAGVLVYVVVGAAASVLLTLARLQPISLLLRQVLGMVSVIIFGALHYVYGMGIVRSAAAWAVIYIGARLLVARIEARAMQRFRSA